MPTFRRTGHRPSVGDRAPGAPALRADARGRRTCRGVPAAGVEIANRGLDGQRRLVSRRRHRTQADLYHRPRDLLTVGTADASDARPFTRLGWAPLLSRDVQVAPPRSAPRHSSARPRAPVGAGMEAVTVRGVRTPDRDPARSSTGRGSKIPPGPSTWLGGGVDGDVGAGQPAGRPQPRGSLNHAGESDTRTSTPSTPGRRPRRRRPPDSRRYRRTRVPASKNTQRIVHPYMQHLRRPPRTGPPGRRGPRALRLDPPRARPGRPTWPCPTSTPGSPPRMNRAARHPSSTATAPGSTCVASDTAPSTRRPVRCRGWQPSSSTSCGSPGRVEVDRAERAAADGVGRRDLAQRGHHPARDL